MRDYQNIRDYFSMLLSGLILNSLVIAIPLFDRSWIVRLGFFFQATEIHSSESNNYNKD